MNIVDALGNALEGVPNLFRRLNEAESALFVQLIHLGKLSMPVRSTSEERAITRTLTLQLREAGIADAQRKANVLMQLYVQDRVAEYLVPARKPQFPSRNLPFIGSKNLQNPP